MIGVTNSRRRTTLCANYLCLPRISSRRKASKKRSRARFCALRFIRLWHLQKNKPQIIKATAKNGNGLWAFKALNIQPVEMKQVNIKYTMIFILTHIDRFMLKAGAMRLLYIN